MRADLRRRKYLEQPHVAVEYMTNVTGEFLHPEFVNFDVLAKNNYEAFKTRMLGEDRLMQRLCIEPSDDSVEKLTKSEMVHALRSTITSTTHGVERVDRMKELQRVSPSSKAALRELWDETMVLRTDTLPWRSEDREQ